MFFKVSASFVHLNLGIFLQFLLHVLSSSVTLQGDCCEQSFSGLSGVARLDSSQGSGWVTQGHSQSWPKILLCCLSLGHCPIVRWTFSLVLAPECWTDPSWFHQTSKSYLSGRSPQIMGGRVFLETFNDAVFFCHLFCLCLENNPVSELCGLFPLPMGLVFALIRIVSWDLV